MEIRVERDTEIRPECSEVYEPPMLDEIGRFAALTRANVSGSFGDRSGYYS
ncbi:MAG: lasso RiPP family leader peptide-containing protein [Pseudonocardiaceae bacterium]